MQELALFLQQFSTYIEYIFLVVLDDSLVGHIGAIRQREIAVFMGYESSQTCLGPFVESFTQGDTQGVPDRSTTVLVDGVITEEGMLKILSVLCIVLSDVFPSVEIHLQRMDETSHWDELLGTDKGIIGSLNTVSR